MPLPNSFRTQDEEQDGFAPCCLMFCKKCSNAQLSVTVDPAILYKNYAYVTSPSKTMRDHITQLYHDLCAEQSPGKHSPLESVFEIGSNDGTLLKQFSKMGASSVVGMEPAKNLACTANERGIRTLNKFFCKDTIIHNAGLIGVPDVILARHVFCHRDDWHDFIEALDLLCSTDTLVCIEVPYAGDTIELCEWDQIYFEHLSYLSIHAMEALLDGTGFHLHKIKRYPIHGGSIVLMLRRNDWEGDINESIPWFLAYEEEAINAETWTRMGVRAKDNMDHLFCILEDMHNQGKVISGMGASAKSTVWINASGIGKFISFIADETPQKIGKMSPGSSIPILPESALIEKNPNYVLCFAWNYKKEVMEKFPGFRGRWIIPVPEVTIE